MMKTTLFLLFSFILYVNAAPDAVLDIAGEELRSGTDYYILPVVRGQGGGLTLSQDCPHDVVQENNEVSNGLPLTFSPVDGEGVVRVSTDQNIEFSAASICVQSTVWKLDNLDESTQQRFVTTGGVKGNPGRETVSYWFKIEKYEDDYKLLFCPSVCDVCRVICMEVGIYVDDAGVRRLALSDEPLKVMFKKA